MRSGKYKSKALRNSAFAFALLCFIGIAAHSQTSKPTAPSSFRTITIITEPDSELWIDGVSYGKSDDKGRITVSTLSAGRHTLIVRSDGFKEVQRVLTATAKGAIDIPLTKTTDEAELSFQQGVALTGVDRARSAEAFRKAIKRRPGYVDAYIGLARVLSDARDYENALKVIGEVRKIKPAVAEVSAIEGRILRDGGQEAEAIAAFKRAIREAKGFQPEAYTGLGLIYKERAEGFAGEGEYEKEAASYVESAKYLTTAIKQLSGAPDAVVVYQILGLIYEQQKRYPEAISVYNEFLQVFPDIPESASVASFIVQLKKQMAQP